jgi:hypothetical protein
MEDWWKQLRWVATAHGWVAKTDEVALFVSEQVYEQHLQAYLDERGITLKSWIEVMRPAEEEWQRQCEVMNAFQSNLAYWLALRECGVEIRPLPQKVK